MYFGHSGHQITLHLFNNCLCRGYYLGKLTAQGTVKLSAMLIMPQVAGEGTVNDIDNITFQSQSILCGNALLTI